MTAGLPQSQEAAGSLYIINLRSSTTPMALEIPDAPGLSGFAVFRSRRIEDGRDRFRLHLGYFDSQEQAEGFLPLLRERYPAAWVALAPKDGMGSLDDTSVAQFKLIRQKKTGGDAPQAPQTGSPRTATPLAVAKPQIPAPKVPVQPLIAPSPKAEPATTDSFLKPAEVLRLLETGLPDRKSPAQEQKSPGATSHATSSAPATQKFAVQLIWSTQRPDLSKLPRPVIFEAYSLYTVAVQRGPDKWYGLRLGFFNDAVSARQLALYVRPDFKMVSVVPVSERECARAEESMKAAAEKAVARKKAAAPAAKKSDLNQAPPAAKPRTSPASAARPAPPASDLIAAKQGIKEALASLDEVGAFDEVRDSDPSESGVRHLSVSIVKRKNSAFGKVLSRAAGRR